MGHLILTCKDTLSINMVGGKFRRQKKMADQGFYVPPFYCLTTLCYHKVFAPLADAVTYQLEHLDFKKDHEVRHVSEQIRSFFIETTLDSTLKEKIFRHFDTLFKPETLVSVRSSIVGQDLEESEDSAHNPLAGLSESFLYIPKDKILEKLPLCWASGFSPQALVYRFRQGMNMTGFSVAVGIQKMIMGKRSFVLFTCDPTTAARNTIIAAGFGIGEGIVQGKAPTDHYFVNRRSGRINRQIAKKTTLLALDQQKGFGVTPYTVPKEKQLLACLSDREILLLAKLGQKIEQIFGCPQDIEGTITPEGSMHILQARPVFFDHQRNFIWTNANVTESFPGPTTALTYSMARFFYRVIFYDCYRRLGIDRQTLQDNYRYLDRMIGFLKGRIYYCLNSFYHLHNLSPLFPLFCKHWEKMMGFSFSYRKTNVGRICENIKRRIMPSAALVTMVTIYRYFTHQRDMKRFHRWWEKLIHPLREKNLAREDPPSLMMEYWRVWMQVGNRWGITLLNDTYLPVIHGIVESLLKRWGLDLEGPALLNDLLCGEEKMISVEIILSAVRLAEWVQNDRKIKQAFEQKGPGELWQAVKENAFGPSFCKAVRGHLRHYGDRGLHELKMERPNLRHTPDMLLMMIKEYVRSGTCADDIRTKDKRIRENAQTRLNKALKGHPLKRYFLNIVLTTLRRLIRNRENARYCRSELFGFTKNIFREMGRQFSAKEILTDPDDIVHLTHEEIFGCLDGTGVIEDLNSLARLRKKEFEENKKALIPEEITTCGPIRENIPSMPTQQADFGLLLRGLGSSTGKVRGTARIILDPNRPGELGKDVILIARETDPGWLFLMTAAKGIIVERGSILSHTAITGRKFGIPTVVALPGATTCIPDGAFIEMDGASGIVTILKKN